MDFDFTERLIGRFELRYTEQEETVRDFAYVVCDATTADCGDDVYDLRFPDPLPNNPDDSSNSSNSGSADFSSVTGRLGLDYKLNDNWMMYGSVATGDKPGGIQLATPNVITPNGTERENITSAFDTEKLTAYEIGLKGITEDGRIGLDAALFFNDCEDIVLRQILEESPVSGRQLEQPTDFNVNAGTAEVWSFEVTTDIGFTENFTGRLTVNWNDATLTDAQQNTFETFPSFAPDDHQPAVRRRLRPLRPDILGAQPV